MGNLETKNCPYCAEEINIEAIKCKHCGEFLNKRTDSNFRLEKQDIISIVFGVLMVAFFFMPWFQWTFISVSGYEIPNYLTNLDNMFGKNSSPEDIHRTTIVIYALFYSIPLFSFVSAFLPLVKKKTSVFSTLAATMFLLLFFFSKYILEDWNNIDIFNILGVGGYLSLLLSVIVVLYGFARMFNNIRILILQKSMSASLKFIAFPILVVVLIILIINCIINSTNSKQGHDVYSTVVGNKYMDEIAAENKESMKESDQELKSFISKDKKGENFGDFIKKFGADKNFQLSRIKFPIIVYGEMISSKDVVNYHPSEYFKEVPMGGEEGEYEYYLKKKLTKDNWDHLNSRHFKPSASVNINGSDYQCSFRIYSEHNVEFSLSDTGPSCWNGVQYKFNKIDGKWYFVGF